MNEYDAVVVGARCAGSATAMLMARAGLRVLLLDRVHPGRDTLSTHALMRAGVLQLDRWGLLDEITAAGTPSITGTTFHYADADEHVALNAPLYAPRRTVLDPVLLDAAVAAGVEVELGVDVTRVTRDDTGRVNGVRVRARAGQERVVRAALTVGADGLRSGIARAVDAHPSWQGTAAGALVYGYWPTNNATGYHWFYRPGGAAGVIPTNDGQVCVWAGLPAAEFALRRRGGLERVFTDVLADVAPSAALLATGERVGPLRGFPGRPAVLRRPVGPGWALVGDAGSFKDPLTAHGITDALRDAELLARAAIDGSPAAFADYARTRDALTLPLLRVAEEIAAYRWDTPQVKQLLRAESAAMKPEVGALRALDLTMMGSAA
jgi:flavin-dependent dehydrogenase